MKASKYFVLTIFLTLSAYSGFSRSFIDLWGGAGLSLYDNYNIGISYGLNYYGAVSNGVGLGISVASQSFNLIYDRENNSKFGGTITNASQYYFISPMIVVHLSRTGNFQGYVNGGVGMLGSGKTTINKWNTAVWPVGAAYDSSNTLKSGDFETMTYRIGVGLIQYCSLGGNFHLYVNEDVGIVPIPFSKTPSSEYSGFSGNVNQIFTPTYVSIRLGLAYISKSRNCRTPGRIEKRKK